MLFDGEVADVKFGPDQTSAEVTALTKLSTPCGTLSFPAGSRIRFGKVVVEGNIIQPLSGGRIDRLR
jgi:hypothetical protein